MPILILLLLCAATLAGQSGDDVLFKWGFEQRVRNENWDNILDYNDTIDDQRNQIRYRTRLWMMAPLNKDIDLHLGLNQETNQIFVARTPWRLNEIVFETAFLDFKRLPIKGLSFRIGRQNLIKGEATHFLEGNPWDGSRSIYVNMADLAYSWKKSKLELIGIWDPYRDRFLPKIHNQRRPLIEWSEQALGLYYTDNNHKKTAFDLYFFHKKEYDDYRPRTNAQFQPDRYTDTGGARVVQQLKRGYSLTGEVAFQSGNSKPSVPIRAWSASGYLKKTWTHKSAPYLRLAYWGFSGDDPKTKDKIEGWSQLFARWPKWSELYIYSQLPEVGVGYWTNTSMFEAEAGCKPYKTVGFRVTAYSMDAFHPFPGRPTVFGAGTRRGENYQGRVDFTFGKHWKAHVLYERQVAGDFYSRATPGYFLRFEFIYLLEGTVHRANNKH